MKKQLERVGIVICFLLLIPLGRMFSQTSIGTVSSGCVGNSQNCHPLNVDSNGNLSLSANGKTQVVDGAGNVLPTLPSGPVMPVNADGVVVSYEGLTSGGITVAMTATTSMQVIAATPGQNIYLSSCTVSNASTTVSTDIILQDGSGGTTIWNFPAPAASTATTGGGGSTHSFGEHPLKVPTQGNPLFAANVTTGSSTKIFCNGFKSANSY